MFIAIHNDFILVRTPFNSTHDLVQKFRGINNQTLTYNAPIDFAEAGLVDNSKWDYWHIDKFFNVSSDEATPTFTNGTHIGANHGQPCAVSVCSQNHQKTFADIGSLWQDQAGVKFTLIRVVDQNVLQFVSENQKENKNDYLFVKKITGNLIYLENGKDNKTIIVQKQHNGYLSRSNRYKEKKVFVYDNGEWSPFFGAINCEMAEIREVYDIINPATVAEDLRKNRPENGYSNNLDLSQFGEPMITFNLTYRIMSDGTILSLFDVENLTNVNLHHYFGVMFQEKLDAYGGGVFRIIPNTKPMDCEEGVFDFTKPVALYGKPFPNTKHVTPEYFANADCPPDRIIDLFKDANQNFKLGFACGFLPLFDCQPQVRKNNLDCAVHIKHTRKGYPMAAYGSISKLKGVGYKKFFIPQNGTPVYTIPYEKEEYIYIDFIKEDTVKIPITQGVKVLQKTDGVEWFQDCSTLTVTGKNGYALFIKGSI